ncbi:hypothetical protein LINPERPRIM_LOCUS6008, partial [Linum perenne]
YSLTQPTPLSFSLSLLCFETQPFFFLPLLTKRNPKKPNSRRPPFLDLLSLSISAARRKGLAATKQRRVGVTPAW